MSIEHIEYPSRAALAEALPDVMKQEGITRIDVVDLGRTLRVQYEGDAPEQPEGSSQVPDLTYMNREQIRALVADYALDVQVPDEGELKPVKQQILEALGGTR